MGTCLSKKSVCANSSSAVTLPIPPKSETSSEKKLGEEQQPIVKKEIFIIKHRTSHEIERQVSDEERGEPKKAEEFAGNGESGSSRDANSNGGLGNVAGGVIGGAAVRTSSCTKEEVDAILIQCGRLSRSSSTGKAAAGASSENGRRQYSGSKRSYDFDNETGKSDGGNNGDDEREIRRRERQRQSPGRRRTPSRERERDQLRSGSRERGGSGGGRRVSRSPGRRSESPITTTAANSDPNSNPNSRPGKMVSVPATDKTAEHNNNNATSNSIERIQVKRNATSPRARSPARTRASVDNHPQQPLTLSRSNSRNSPYRRNPLAEIDTNVIVPRKPNADATKQCKEEPKTSPIVIAENVSMNVIQDPKPQSITRSRSSRLSRDLDNPNASYTALLLEDIQNFHQKKSNPVTLPACVTKAHSILEAVADLNAKTVPVLESEVVGNGDDLMEPSFHKYVTVRRGGGSASDDLEEQQESSGSNSFAGSQQQQQWVSPSCWEPNSAESTAFSSSSSRAVSSSKQSAISESGVGGKRVITVKKRESGRVGTRGPPMIASST